MLHLKQFLYPIIEQLFFFFFLYFFFLYGLIVFVLVPLCTYQSLITALISTLFSAKASNGIDYF